jgi:hypothetical protein
MEFSRGLALPNPYPSVNLLKIFFTIITVFFAGDTLKNALTIKLLSS